LKLKLYILPFRRHASRLFNALAPKKCATRVFK